ncbi:hypothetical protein B0H10DRAFT_2013856 [Mycena sp. CBHHK59/15]|nr:hypothetical protein B0H10DRAFT_2013856 [Mycena sp. CBHHK59/15]
MLLPGAPPLSWPLHCPFPPRMPVHLIYLPTGHPLLPPCLACFAVLSPVCRIRKLAGLAPAPTP